MTTIINGWQAYCKVCGPLGPAHKNLDDCIEEINQHKANPATKTHKPGWHKTRFALQERKKK
jgi:hypothetical protein